MRFRIFDRIHLVEIDPVMSTKMLKPVLNPEKNFLVTKKARLKTPAMNYNTASAAKGMRLNRTYSYLVIPLIAVLIPNVAGLITNSLYEPWELALSYLFFTITGFIIWNGNMRLIPFSLRAIC